MIKNVKANIKKIIYTLLLKTIIVSVFFIIILNNYYIILNMTKKYVLFKKMTY